MYLLCTFLRLSLAWNDIGLDHDNFGALCSALQLNGHIQGPKKCKTIFGVCQLSED